MRAISIRRPMCSFILSTSLVKTRKEMGMMSVSRVTSSIVNPACDTHTPYRRCLFLRFVTKSNRYLLLLKLHTSILLSKVINVIEEYVTEKNTYMLYIIFNKIFATNYLVKGLSSIKRSTRKRRFARYKNILSLFSKRYPTYKSDLK